MGDFDYKEEIAKLLAIEAKKYTWFKALRFYTLTFVAGAAWFGFGMLMGQSVNPDLRTQLEKDHFFSYQRPIEIRIPVPWEQTQPIDPPPVFPKTA